MAIKSKISGQAVGSNWGEIVFSADGNNMLRDLWHESAVTSNKCDVGNKDYIKTTLRI
jgi:hypothetical protein